MSRYVTALGKLQCPLFPQIIGNYFIHQPLDWTQVRREKGNDGMRVFGLYLNKRSISFTRHLFLFSLL